MELMVAGEISEYDINYAVSYYIAQTQESYDVQDDSIDLVLDRI